MNKLVEEQLAKLRLKLCCGKVLFTILSVLLALLFAPIIALCYIVMTVIAVFIMMIFVIIFCIVSPIMVLYKCIKNDCNFKLEEEYVNDKL